jgi:hypothetical protein
VTGTALALKPPYPRRAGSCSIGFAKLVVKGRSVARLRWPFPKMDGLLLPMRIHMQRCSAELAGRRYLAVKPILFMS